MDAKGYADATMAQIRDQGIMLFDYALGQHPNTVRGLTVTACRYRIWLVRWDQ